jgi:hypothetical protein
VVTDLEAREKKNPEPVHIINIDIQDNPEEATIGAFMICDLCALVCITFFVPFSCGMPVRFGFCVNSVDDVVTFLCSLTIPQLLLTDWSLPYFKFDWSIRIKPFCLRVMATVFTS